MIGIRARVIKNSSSIVRKKLNHSKKSSMIKNIPEKERGNKSVLISTMDRRRNNGLKNKKRH